MALWHTRYNYDSFQTDPCNTLYPDWDSWCDGTWPMIFDNIMLKIDMEKANMLYTKYQPCPMYTPLLPPADEPSLLSPMAT